MTSREYEATSSSCRCYGSRTFSAYFAHFGGRLLSLATTVILARVLEKEDFGVAGYAIVTIALLDMLQDLGIGPALIYHEEDYERSNTAFWLGIAISLVLFGLVWAAAPLAANFFHDERATSVIRILSFTFPMTALSNVHDSLLRRSCNSVAK